MSPSEVELVRLGRIDRQIRLGIAAVALLLLAAVVKPWPGHGAAGPTDSARPREFVAGVSANVPSPSASPTNIASALCASRDRWLIVADDVEQGRPVRTWLVAGVEYSVVPPVHSTIPVTTLVSSEVVRLGFCLPVSAGEPRNGGWSGTLWRQGADAANPTQWQAAARLDPAPGSLDALAYPVNKSAIAWPPGLYFLEARFVGLDREAWLGLLIQRRPT